MTTRIGLISDTHMPQRWPQLPAQIGALFEGCDLILHAGDVGELWVLDQLAAIAPVIAVHGNDETEAAQAALPYLQTVVCAGQRIVLTHAHYPDRAAEIASRVNDWQPHFERRVGFARQHGAEIIVFGHTHIPMLLQHEDVWLVNPGAIASGNPWMRQLVQTVAVMTLTDKATPQITHYDLKDGAIHQPIFDQRGFAETAQHYSDTIITDDVLPHRNYLWWQAPDIVREALLALSHECWTGQRPVWSMDDLMARLRQMHAPDSLLSTIDAQRKT